MYICEKGAATNSIREPKRRIRARVGAKKNKDRVIKMRKSYLRIYTRYVRRVLWTPKNARYFPERKRFFERDGDGAFPISSLECEFFGLSRFFACHRADRNTMYTFSRVYIDTAYPVRVQILAPRARPEGDAKLYSAVCISECLRQGLEALRCTYIAEFFGSKKWMRSRSLLEILTSTGLAILRALSIRSHLSNLSGVTMPRPAPKEIVTFGQGSLLPGAKNSLSRNFWIWK